MAGVPNGRAVIADLAERLGRARLPELSTGMSHDFEAAIRTTCEPIFEKPLGQISFAQLLVYLFQTARRFNLEVQPRSIFRHTCGTLLFIRIQLQHALLQATL